MSLYKTGPKKKKEMLTKDEHESLAEEVRKSWLLRGDEVRDKQHAESKTTIHTNEKSQRRNIYGHTPVTIYKGY